jgi:excisionase family DNA binding protein
MKFFREIETRKTEAQPPLGRPLPMRPKGQPPVDEAGRLADLKTVARQLRVSPRYVQQLTRRKAIPVIRLGRRCTRYDLDAVLAALRRFEVHEMGR